jgi:hypothetical protein
LQIANVRSLQRCERGSHSGWYCRCHVWLRFTSFARGYGGRLSRRKVSPRCFVAIFPEHKHQLLTHESECQPSNALESSFIEAREHNAAALVGLITSQGQCPFLHPRVRVSTHNATGVNVLTSPNHGSLPFSRARVPKHNTALGCQSSPFGIPESTSSPTSTSINTRPTLNSSSTQDHQHVDNTTHQPDHLRHLRRGQATKCLHLPRRTSPSQHSHPFELHRAHLCG